MSLDLDVAVRLGPLDLAARMSVGAETVALVGPNGAGKTTLLRTVAGLVALDGGRIELDGCILDEVSTGRHVPVAERHLGVVFQDRLLFPHLDALGNVAFGLRARGVDRRTAEHEAARWLEQVGLGDRTGTEVTRLSGGQAQRVALARALATQPDALLLDEPLSGLDVAARGDIRRLLHEHLAAFDKPVILVTHDPVEAAMLAGRLVVLEDGRITHDAPAAEISRHPRSAWVARMAGLNLYRGVAADGRVDIGTTTIVAAGAPDGDVLLTVAPVAVALYRSRPEGSPRNVWELEVTGLDRHGDRVRVELGGAIDIVAEITPGAVAELRVAGGDRLWAAVKATEVAAYPA